MSSKKKPRPLFEVPADMESGGESGWVYRSAGRTERAEAPPSGAEMSGASMMDSGAAVLALGLTAIARTMVLGLTIATIPLTLSVRALRSFTRPE